MAMLNATKRMAQRVTGDQLPSMQDSMMHVFEYDGMSKHIKAVQLKAQNELHEKPAAAAKMLANWHVKTSCPVSAVAMFVPLLLVDNSVCMAAAN